MTPSILGIGLVTAAGNEPGTLLDAIRAGVSPTTTDALLPGGRAGHRVALVTTEPPPELVRHPRFRRASRISLLAADAALRAMRDAGLDPASGADREGLALVFAVSTGSVVYSARFFAQVVETGPAMASPLLFPETVYNAPASHLAAFLGLDGLCETLVGDAPAGISALARAGELLATGQARRVVVVGAEEIDASVCEGYSRWRIRPVMAEGAAALVLSAGPDGTAPLLAGIGETIGPAKGTGAAKSLARAIAAALGEAPPPGAIVGSADGTFLDRVESEALRLAGLPPAGMLPKRAIGEPIGAGALVQAAVACALLRAGEIGSALVTCAGFRGQFAAARFDRPRKE